MLVVVVNVKSFVVLFVMIFSVLIFAYSETGANQGWGERAWWSMTEGM